MRMLHEIITAGLSPALRVLALDLRGRGLSDKPDSGYSLADHAADVLGLMDAMKQMPFLQGRWDRLIENYYRADVEIRNDGTVKPLTRPEAIIEAVGKLLAEDWPRHMAAVKQPMLLLNALGPFGPPGTPPILPIEQALATVQAVADGRHVEVPGNHMTMLFGEGAQRIVKAILEFVRS